MKFTISTNYELLQTLYPVFEQSYRQFLGQKTAHTFNQACDQAVAVSIIFGDSKPIAFTFHREMICDDWSKAPEYFRDTSHEFLKMIRGERILTLEWLTVAPEHIGKFTRVQPVELIIGLGLRLMKESVYTAGMGFSRQDNRMDQVPLRVGARSYGTVDRFGIPCSVIFIRRHELVDHRIKQVAARVEELWQNRENYITAIERKVAA